ncbi:hypothetical protein MRB53_023007 [Persea americana]|uniref:Uncharacterized protein n=1 Tax=Persea americana TaxID=3435 RepID=A0ACC2L9H6_PERAE|nr:hypothetical protein MRB53_023007 [Persea americana]
MNEEGRGAIGSQLVGERAKIILDEVRESSLLDRSQCLQHIGVVGDIAMPDEANPKTIAERPSDLVEWTPDDVE